MEQIFKILLINFSFLIVSQFNDEKPEELFKVNDSFSAKVVAVQSGDLITIQLDNELFRIRLAEIDSPEPRQPFFRQARLFTEGLALNQIVKINVNSVDRYQRIVGVATLPDGKILNNEVVRWGFAWHYKVSPTPNLFLDKLEYRAWERRLGFWVEKLPLPPWKFRAESMTPDPPSSPNNVNYDQIFEYGLFGNKKDQVFSWPACLNYKLPPKEDRIVFSNKLEANNFGYRSHKACPK